MTTGVARLCAVAIICAGLLAVPLSAQALDPQRSLAQYKHTRWTVEDGAPPGVEVLAQTPDGYLWLGSTLGLYRFDGVTFEAMRPPQPSWSMNDRVVSLMVTRDGALWAGYERGGIGVYKNGRFKLLFDPKIHLGTIIKMAEGRDGVIWAATSNSQARLARYAKGVWTPVTLGREFSGKDVTDLLVARDGALWVAVDGAAAVLTPSASAFKVVRSDLGEGVGFAQDAAGRIWAADAKGARVIAGSPAPKPFYPLPRASRVTRIIVDHDQNLWGAQHPDGVFRIRLAAGLPADLPAEETASVAEGLSSAMAYSVFEDREGDIWVATVRGLDRYRPASVTPESVVPLNSPYGYVAFADARGVVYISDSTTLYRARPGERLTPFVHGLSAPTMMCDAPGGGVWVGLTGAKIIRIDGDKVTPVKDAPYPDAYFSACAADAAGDMWVAAFMEVLVRYDGKAWAQFKPKAVGRAVTALAADKLGRIVADGGKAAVLWDGGGFRTITTLPRPKRGGTMPMTSGPLGVLSGSDNGLTRFIDDRSEFISRERFRFLGLGHGLGQADQTTWLWGSEGLARMRDADLDRAFKDPAAPLPVRIFDLKDGLPGLASYKYRSDLAIGGDGRVWVTTTAGVASLDPKRQPFNRVPPPVVIRALVVDGVRTDDPKAVTLPKGARNVQIDYTALSLAIPERMGFRYRLEGVDAGWVDPGGRRQAFYTNLKPGRYVFRVKAANNDGVWNEQGARLDIDLPPTFLQSRVFFALCLLAVGALVWLGYTLRVRQISDRIHARLRERLAERERIARELHDTLLQGVQGLMLKFQSATRQVPADLPARGLLDRALDRAEDIVVEARDRVRSLRADAASDLAATLADVAQRMTLDSAAKTEVRVEGVGRGLHPVVADEVERIVVEALFNAHRHAAASHIVIEIAFDPRQLGVRVRDDGAGIDQAVLDDGGRAGHFGLKGMQERASKIDGVLTIRSRSGQGAEIEVTVPGAVAYASRKRSWWAILNRRSALAEEVS
jgi:signal transduction histidine kinase/sugar lactone lactonase YvrE